MTFEVEAVIVAAARHGESHPIDIYLDHFIFRKGDVECTNDGERGMGAKLASDDLGKCHDRRPP
jgi:hypothetical protein